MLLHIFKCQCKFYVVCVTGILNSVTGDIIKGNFIQWGYFSLPLDEVTAGPRRLCVPFSDRGPGDSL